MNDILVVGFLVILEGLLSFDNALALAAMVRHLPSDLQKKALTYGMVGAFAFRFVSLFFVTLLIQFPMVKLIGAGYLLWLSGKYFYTRGADQETGVAPYFQFWKTILYVELTDMAFSIDSILAAVGVSSKLWVVVTGGILGIIAMRFVANFFISLIARFPELERSAFLLIAIVGVKIGIEVGWDVDFDSGLSCVLLWSLMAAAFASGFGSEKRVRYAP